MSLPLAAGTWSLDPVHSVVEFSIRHLGISMIRGRFLTIGADLAVGADLAGTTLTAEVDMSSVDTGNGDRDNHLRSTDIFNVESQPKMTFVSSAIEATGDGRYAVTGDMTINGTTKAETLDVTFDGTEDNPLDGSTRGGFRALTTIDRTAYGIDWNVPLPTGGAMLGTDVEIVLDTQLVGPSDG